MKRIKTGIMLLFLFQLSIAAQDLQTGAIFTDNMILQQQTQAPVWGWAKKNASVNLTTSWDGKSYNAVAGTTGKWITRITTPAAGGPYSIKITAGTSVLELQNIYVGEVWLASGQSNMSMPLKGYSHQPVTGSTEAILGAKNKKIHFINIPAMAAYRRQDTFKNALWEAASPANAGECSAVAWFFADCLNRQLDVPVGIIHAAYGGSNIEAWMTETACRELKEIEVPDESDETSPWISNVPTVLYNAMIHPLEGYAIKGMIWYQGESNIFNVPRYAPSVAAMVKDWRKRWNQGDFPFYFAQIAPYEYKEWNFFTPQWPEISAYQREAQMKSQALIPNSGMAVLLDVGEEYQIHPSRKKEAGFRLALLALAKTYSAKGFEFESPEYERLEIIDDKAVLHFAKPYGGLTSYGKELKQFEIAGENRVFQNAKAYIDEEKGTIIVTSPLVKEPKAVRYAFKNYVNAELFGTGGLPVSSFRTDNW